MLDIRTGVSGHIQEHHFQNGTRSVTRNRFSVTAIVDLSSDVTLNGSISEEEVADRVKQLLGGLGAGGLDITVLVGDDSTADVENF